ncbi:MAG: hypothetical protein AAB289_12660 [Chloroflexota bacterium]
MSPTLSGPLVVPQPLGRPEKRASGVWRVRWRLTNQTEAALRLLEAWFPHNLYFNPRQRFDPPAGSLAAGESIEAAFDITCAAPPGAVVENAFLILQATALGVRWRLLARLTVTVAEDGAPMAAVETITAQRAGFSAGAFGGRSAEVPLHQREEGPCR